MRYISNGKEKIPFVSLLAILSISLTVNLPGLAISPILDKLDQVFTHVTELETQLLTVLPNLITIPFILCAGKISTQKNQLWVLGIGLGIYTLSGVLYFFADSMTQLILLSCLLGVGCGLVIPLAASLISQHFYGSSRTRQLGNKSSLSNFSVIFATLFVGWVAAINWHLAFIVYLVPVLPLVLIPFMSSGYIARHSVPDTKADSNKEPMPPREPAGFKPLFTGKRAVWLLVGIMVLYFGATYGIEVVSYYLPYTMQHYGHSTTEVGVATAMFFLAASVAGFFLTPIIRFFKENTIQASLMMCVIGLLGCGFLHSQWAYVAGVFVMGLGYGVIQPVIYDKTSQLAPSSAKSTEYFAYLLTCNYVGISAVPFIVSGFKRLFDAQADPNFSFYFNGCIIAAVLVLAVVKRRSYVFNPSYSKMHNLK